MRARIVFAAALLAVAVVAVGEGRELFGFYLEHERLPLWDMAGHGGQGVELAADLAEGRPLAFLAHLNEQDKWPFGYSLLLLPFLLLGGLSYASATLASTVWFAAVAPLLVWAGWEVGREEGRETAAVGAAGGLVAAALWLVGPLPGLLAVLILREAAAVAFSLLAFLLYLRACRRGDLAAWRWAGLGALGLFLIKTNYGAIWLLAAAGHQVLALEESRRRRLAAWARGLAPPWRGAGWGRRLLAIYLALLLALALAGENAGAALYPGLVAGAGIFLYRAVRNPAALKAAWRRLAAPWRAAAETVVAPLWLWCLSPDPIHPKEIWGFLRNRSGELPLFSADSLLYYPRVLAEQYAPVPAVGWAVLALAAASGLALLLPPRRAGAGPRLLAAVAALQLLLPVLHSYKQPRFFAVGAAMWMLLAGWGLARGAARLVGGGAALAASGLAAALICGAFSGGSEARLAAEYPYHSGDPAYAPVLVWIGEIAGPEPLGLVGTFNQVSPYLVRWNLRRARGGAAPDLVGPLGRFAAGAAPEVARKKLERWLERRRPEQIVALRPSPDNADAASADFRVYNAYQLAALAALEAHPGWRRSHRRAFPGAGLEVLRFVPATGR